MRNILYSSIHDVVLITVSSGSPLFFHSMAIDNDIKKIVFSHIEGEIRIEKWSLLYGLQLLSACARFELYR